jgi:Sporulation and spore germination
MFHRQSVGALLILALVSACAAPAASPSPAVSGTPTAILPSPTASPSAVPTATPTPSPTLVPATPSPTVAPSTSSPTPTTMTVRAYFLMRDGSGGEVVNEPTLVPVLRTVPRSTATATAAMKALLAGPSAKERAPTWPIKTLIPADSKLLGIEISEGLATVDLSAEFASPSPDDVWDLGSYSLHGRVAQVVYTLTQFTTVDRVNFKLDATGSILLIAPTTHHRIRFRAPDREHMLRTFKSRTWPSAR